MNRNNLNRRFLILAIMPIAIFLASCGGAKKVAQPKTPTKPVVQAKDYSELYKTVFEYETFAGKAKMKFENEKQKQNFTANLKLQKKEKVWASIIAMGLAEVARAQITPDKLQAIERINRNAYDMGFQEGIQKLNAPITFPMLENLLIGNPIMEGLKVENVKEQGSEVVLTMQHDGYVQVLTYDKNLQTLLRQEIKSEAKKFFCAIEYKDYITLLGQNFSKSRLIKIEDNAKGTTTLLEMDFNSHELNVPLDIQFSIPSNYKKKEQ